MEQTALRAPGTTGATGWGAQDPGPTFERARSTQVGDGLVPVRRQSALEPKPSPFSWGCGCQNLASGTFETPTLSEFSEEIFLDTPCGIAPK